MRKVDIILRDKRLRNHVLVNNKSIRFSRDKNTHLVLYHFETEDEIWFVFPTVGSGEKGVSYNDAVEEALCF